MITVTLLGTAATMPLPERALTSVLLSYDGRSILFDCGEGTQTAARKAHASLMKTDLIALTHYHGDHIFGLPGLLQTYACLGRSSPLWITGPDGLEEVLGTIMTLAGPLPYAVYALFLSDEKCILSDFLPGWSSRCSLTPFATKHRVPSFGYRFSLSRPGKFRPDAAATLSIPQQLWHVLQNGEPVTLGDGRTVCPEAVMGEERKGLSVVYSGDTAPCHALTEKALDTDLLICEATYGCDSDASHAAQYGHCTFSQAARTADDAHAKRLWLTHFSQIMETPEDCLPNAASIFPGAVCGTDGMSITLNFS
jgi:ribonuclease Z